MHRIDGVVQPYAWGDPTVIAELQGRTPTGEPEAELWLGAHPKAPSVLRGAGRTLLDAVGADPSAVLGAAVDERFGQFPFLLKVLAAADPLSIQVHPTLDQARAGFAREEAAGVGRSAPDRTYRDDNHKPELICALTTFEAKCGFRPAAQLHELVAALARSLPGPTLQTWADELAAAGDGPTVVGDAARSLLARDRASAAELVEAIVTAADALARAGGAVAEREQDTLTWTSRLAAAYPGDIGVAVALLLNHVLLQPGEAMFLRAGIMHSYLRGTGVELMANSDNVIRGGLTPKHVDVAELAVVLDGRSTPAPVQKPTEADHVYDSPVPEFTLERLSGEGERTRTPAGPEIVLVTAGSVTLGGDRGHPVVVDRGDAVAVFADHGLYQLVLSADAVVWRATVGAAQTPAA
ncbi:MAG: mannose-6-phosphate isomerase, class I [Actinomycetota bacterium]